MTEFEALVVKIKEAKLKDKTLLEVSTKANQEWKAANAELTALNKEMTALVARETAISTDKKEEKPDG